MVAAVAALLLPAAAGNAAPAPTVALHVVATGLNNPRKLTVDSKGTVYVAEAGAGGSDHCYVSGGSKTCIGLTGAVTRIDPHGSRTRVVRGLFSAASTDGSDAEGPTAVVLKPGGYVVLLGDGRVSAHTNLGADGALSGDLLDVPAGSAKARPLANLGAFEAAHDPDQGAGPGAAAGDPALDSNPYDVVAYRGGYAIVDAAANDLLWLSPAGKLSVLAVFPTQSVHVAAGVVGKKSATVTVQSVPTSVVAGADGALYVGELTGYPFPVGKARVWRVVPGRAPTVYADGLTNISGLAFDGKDLLVLEIASKGLRDATSPGALIRLSPGGRRTVLASAGLVAPTGVAVAGGTIYLSNYGTSAAKGNGHHGEVVSLPA